MRRLTHNLHRRDLRAKDEDGAGDQEDVLEDTRKREDETAARADEEHGGDVQQERDKRVREQDEGAVGRHPSARNAIHARSGERTRRA